MGLKTNSSKLSKSVESSRKPFDRRVSDVNGIIITYFDADPLGPENEAAITHGEVSHRNPFLCHAAQLVFLDHREIIFFHRLHWEIEITPMSLLGGEMADTVIFSDICVLSKLTGIIEDQVDVWARSLDMEFFEGFRFVCKIKKVPKSKRRKKRKKL